MTSSAIPLVKERLQAKLEAAPSLSGVAIERGKPEPGPAEYISIWSAKATREPAGLGGEKLYEQIEVVLVVDVALATGRDRQKVEERAYERAGAAETALREDLTLGDAWLFDRISKWEDEHYLLDKRRGVRVFLTLSGKARI